MLTLTSRARGLGDDPVALWWHLAERMQPKSADPCESQARLILLATLAAQAAEDSDVTTARLLSAIGWVNGDGTELTELTAGHASWDTRIVLRRPGALTDDGHQSATGDLDYPQADLSDCSGHPTLRLTQVPQRGPSLFPR